MRLERTARGEGDVVRKCRKVGHGVAEDLSRRVEPVLHRAQVMHLRGQAGGATQQREGAHQHGRAGGEDEHGERADDHSSVARFSR